MVQKKKNGKTSHKSTRKRDIIKIGNFSIARKKVIKIGGILVVLATIFWFVNSSFWPWPSSTEISRRLNEVIDACMYNEQSRGCSSTQEKYHISFEYCHSLADIPEIDKAVPVYGVAKREGIETREISYRGGDKTLDKYPYYSCAPSLDDINKTSDINILSSEPSTIALFALYKTPHYSISGDNRQCRITLDPGYNFLWDQIPNIEIIKNRYQIVSDTYNKCSMLSDLQSALDGINSELSAYSGNKIVQQFYKYYDEWTNTLISGGKICSSMDDMASGCYMPVTCNFMNKNFYSSICSATTGPSSTNNLESFSNEMRSYTSTDDFTSKIVVTN
ncbi:hypothetical protein IJG92_00615 [Candidatus Saccharibacteria bacterium]|nr:hypothetical protein [Candidatus Saccharibacteria bacterium]